MASVLAQTKTNNNAQTLPNSILSWQYSLARCLANTSLADIYWARNLSIEDDSQPEAYVLLLKVSPALSQLHGFEEILHHVLDNFKNANQFALPNIIDSGNDNGTLWLVCDNTQGMFLSERFQDKNERGKTLNELTPILSAIAQAIGELQPQAYGFLEPGAIQFHDEGVRFLNAPLVQALLHYSKQHAERTAPEQKLTLHSGYVSPTVAVGLTPQEQDDVFSLACFAYHFLKAEPPFQQRHTLEAVVRGMRPAPLKKLRISANDALNRALSLQANERQENTGQFIKELTKRSPLRLVLPTAVAAALAVTAFGITHLIHRAGDYMAPASQVADMQTEQENNTNSDTTLASPNRTNATKPVVASSIVKPSIDKEAIKQQLASLQIELNKQFSSEQNTDLQPVVDQLRSVLQSGGEETLVASLMNKIIAREHSNGIRLMHENNLAAAALPIQRAGDWIREFHLARHSQAQLELETDLRLKREKQVAQERLFAQAKEAFQKEMDGRINVRDENAGELLQKLLNDSPNHEAARELATELVRVQQENIQKSLTTGDMDTARALLDDISPLIRRYVSEAAAQQAALEQQQHEAIKQQRLQALAEQEKKQRMMPFLPSVSTANNDSVDTDISTNRNHTSSRQQADANTDAVVIRPTSTTTLDDNAIVDILVPIDTGLSQNTAFTTPLSNYAPPIPQPRPSQAQPAPAQQQVVYLAPMIDNYAPVNNMQAVSRSANLTTNDIDVNFAPLDVNFAPPTYRPAPTPQYQRPASTQYAPAPVQQSEPEELASFNPSIFDGAEFVSYEDNRRGNSNQYQPQPRQNYPTTNNSPYNNNQNLELIEVPLSFE